jgi:thiamine biosynthesis lipoprotein
MPSSLDRTLRVEHCMGTVFSIDVRTPGDWSAALDQVIAGLHRVDAVFSTYRADSDICRMHRRELRLADADPMVAEVLDLCARAQAETDGAFSATWNGRLDPTGIVKGWAVERASEQLRARGAVDHCVNGGGDVQLSGEARPGEAWTVGIADPLDRTRVLTTVRGRDLAVAGSGTAERGAHVLDPFTGAPVTAFASATVVGPSITFADAYATAALVMGAAALPWIDGLPEYSCLLVAADGRIRASSRWPSAQREVGDDRPVVAR